MTLWVVTGPGSWEWAQHHRDTRLFLLLPADNEPEVYDWRLLAGHDPVLLLVLDEIDHAKADRLAAAILRDGARRISLMFSGGITYYAARRLAA